MIMTPKMWNISKKIEQLAWLHKCDPGDYMLKFELDELRHEFSKLDRIEKLGLKVILGGRQSSNPSTGEDRQIS